jgi:predicted MFS family arabinose efflux permease
VTSRRYALYVLGLLAVVNVLIYFDRNVFAVLIQAIKGDLGVSDAEIGVLSGAALGLVYSISSVPIARLADKGVRVTVLGASVAVWSVMATVSGFAVGFRTMFVARFGVGIGEAGGLPATHALLAEYFRLDRRGMALSVIYAAQSIGIPLGLLCGGLINDAFGWRAAFWMAGVPGVLTAGLIRLTVREPRASPMQAATNEAPGLRYSIASFRKRRSYVLLCLGAALVFIAAYGQQTWTPAFFMRAFHVSSTRAGLVYAFANGPAAIAGTLLSGSILDRLMVRDTRWALRLIIFSFASAFPFAFGTYLARDFAAAAYLVVAAGFLGAIATAPMYALVQALAGSGLRASAAAVFITTTNVSGLLVGPTFTGVISDRLTRTYGDYLGLRDALLCTVIPAALGIALLAGATRTVRADIDAASRE